ncbi:MAG: acetyl ornithine aminotransferase family protein [Anaerolineales bacterium]|nr:acetyl ornithine aminotransferase family protein [Anaerolineales bacterium]
MDVPGPKAREFLTRDKEVISPSYPRAAPFVMERGRGVEVWDVDGNRYLDFMAGVAVTATGHSHPKVVKAIQDQADKFLHISSDFYHPLWVELGEKLDQIAPFSDPAVSFMTNSGTESVEAALKLARYNTGRSQFVSFFGGFHGRTMGSVTLTASNAKYHRGFHPLMNGVVHAPFPNPYRPLLETAPGEEYGERVVRYIEEQIFGMLVSPKDVAGVLIEPIQGEGGYTVPEATFFPALRRLCDKYGILLIVDEVQSGVGRTGRWWAVENFGIEPDIVCSAKGIASGMPLGAMIARKPLVTWPRGAHGNTYGGNPLACAAALATLDLVESDYMANAAEVGGYMMDALEEIQVRHPSMGDVRGIGLMIGVELVKDRATKEPDEQLLLDVVEGTFKHGLLTMGAGKSTLRFCPPLVISRDQVDEGLAIFEEVLTVSEREKQVS